MSLSFARAILSVRLRSIETARVICEHSSQITSSHFHGSLISCMPWHIRTSYRAIVFDLIQWLWSLFIRRSLEIKFPFVLTDNMFTALKSWMLALCRWNSALTEAVSSLHGPYAFLRRCLICISRMQRTPHNFTGLGKMWNCGMWKVKCGTLMRNAYDWPTRNTTWPRLFRIVPGPILLTLCE